MIFCPPAGARRQWHMHTKVKRKSDFTPIEKKWIMYDVGNSAFTLLCSVFIPIIVQALCAEEGMSDTEYQTLR